MKNLLLIGDSIRAGYDKSVRETLAGRANVIFPAENCQFAAYLLRHFHEYFEDLGGEDIDVIHWNAGLWDCLRLFGEEPQTPIDIYAYYIERICLRIKKLCPRAKVIFATSTKVNSERLSKEITGFARYNEETEQYNKVAAEIAEKYGFIINDLYEFSASLPESMHSDAVHFYTPAGTEAFTKQVLSYVVPALGITDIPEYCEELHKDKPVGI